MNEKPLDIDVAMLSASFDARPGSEEVLAAALARYVVMTRHESGCRNVDLVTSVTASGRFLVLQKWDSAALARAHLDSDVMAQMARDVLPLLRDQPVLDLYDTISAHDLA